MVKVGIKSSLLTFTWGQREDKKGGTRSDQDSNNKNTKYIFVF